MTFGRKDKVRIGVSKGDELPENARYNFHIDTLVTFWRNVCTPGLAGQSQVKERKRMPIRLDGPDSVVEAIRATHTAAQQHAKLTPQPTSRTANLLKP